MRAWCCLTNFFGSGLSAFSPGLSPGFAAALSAGFGSSARSVANAPLPATHRIAAAAAKDFKRMDLCLLRTMSFVVYGEGGGGVSTSGRIGCRLPVAGCRAPTRPRLHLATGHRPLQDRLPVASGRLPVAEPPPARVSILNIRRL